MSSINNVNLTGRWASDFVTKKVGEKTVAEGRIAVQTTNKDVAHFFDVKVWEKTAEIAAEYCKKGSFAILSGRLTQESWEKDGEKRSKIVVVAERIVLPPKGGDGGEKPADKAAQPAKSGGKRTVPVDDDADVDLF